jgi:hypothetical protein
MDWGRALWLNRVVVDWIREEEADMSEKKKAIVVGESQSERYTEIEGRKSEALPECCVIAFRDDEWLRELIAAPRIIEIGFSSRAAEVSATPNNSLPDAVPRNIWEKCASRCEVDQRELLLPRQRMRHRVGLREARRIACATLRSAVAAGVLMFYSKSVLGAVIRTFVGA